MSNQDFKKNFSQLEKVLEEYLKEKAPSLPQNWKEFLVKIAPYLTIVGVFFGVLGFLGLLGLGAFLFPVSTFGGLVTGRPFLGLSYLINLLIFVVTLIFQIISIPYLFKRQRKGWQYLYLAVLLNAVSSLISFDILGLIIGSGLSLYLLFQVKEYYK